MHPAPQELRTYHITTSTANRRRLFQVHEKAELLINVLQANREKGRFLLHAFAVMPDHLHLLLTPSAGISIEKAMQYIKGGFSFLLGSKLDVWNPGFNETRVGELKAYRAAVRYIHQNPVKAGLVCMAEEYRFSSAHPSAQVEPMPSWLR